MLQAREDRAQRQRQLLEEFGLPLICFTMNIPGPVKTTPLIRRSFRWGLETLEGRLTGVKHREVSQEITGCEAFLAVEDDPLLLKEICMFLEEEAPIGRLFDLDVLTPAGEKLERPSPRRCIVCGTPGRVCASRRLHSLEQLTREVNGIMTAHFREEDRRYIADTAVEALLQEVRTTPKPGLVDRRNTGSHRDMDIQTFTRSAEALRPYFAQCFTFGCRTARQTPEETFRMLRIAGRKAEEEMYRATGGINTHKGAIFTLGLLCGSMGRTWTPEGVLDLEKILQECSRMGEYCLKEDLGTLTAPTTAGERLYVNLNLTGIRGEAAAGLPSVKHTALPALRKYLSAGHSLNDSAAMTLLHLIVRVEDTNLYHRGGEAGAAWAKAEAAKLLPNPTIKQIEALDDAFIAQNLSPGGSADLLAAALFLHSLQPDDG